jgi:hypothetical protein
MENFRETIPLMYKNGRQIKIHVDDFKMKLYRKVFCPSEHFFGQRGRLLKKLYDRKIIDLLIVYGV